VRTGTLEVSMDTAAFLQRSVGFFKEFSAQRVQQLLDGSRVQSFEVNEVIVHQGTEAAHFGVLLSGTISVSVAGDRGETQLLGRLKAGDTFGEMALMTGDPTVADFIAESRCDVLLIPVALFQSITWVG